MTREQRKQKRRDRVLLIVSMTSLLIWAACVLCTFVNAAESPVLDAPTKALIYIGAFCVSGAFMQAVERLDRGPGSRT